jgi:hypothetical protein
MCKAILQALDERFQLKGIQAGMLVILPFCIIDAYESSTHIIEKIMRREELHTALHQGRGCGHFFCSLEIRILTKVKFESQKHGRRRQAASERCRSCRAEIVGTANKVLIFLCRKECK